MAGMDAVTGKLIDEKAAIEQSIRQILLTPEGSVPLCREFGSEVWTFLDRPVTPEWKMALAAEVVRALGRWETRFGVESVVIAAEGTLVSVTLSGAYRLAGERLRGEVTIGLN